MDDINTAVANRATILVESLHDGSLKLFCWCLEQQFDSFISDRPLLLHSIMALHHGLPDCRTRVRWDPPTPEDLLWIVRA